MKINAAQHYHIAASERSAFVRSAAEYFAGRFSEYAFPRRIDEYAVFVDAGVVDAHAAGITSRREVMRYIEYRFLTGGRIAYDPAWRWLNDLLTDPDRDETERIDRADALVYGGPIRDHT